MILDFKWIVQMTSNFDFRKTEFALGAFKENFKVSAIYKLFFSFCSDHFKLFLQLNSQANKCSKQNSHFLQSQLYNFKQISLKL